MQMLDMGNLNNQVPPGWQFGKKMMFSWRFKYSRRRINKYDIIASKLD